MSKTGNTIILFIFAARTYTLRLPTLSFHLHYCHFIMSEGRRGRRPPLLVTNADQVTHVESTEGAPSIALDDEQVPRAHVEEEQTEAPGKGVVYIKCICL